MKLTAPVRTSRDVASIRRKVQRLGNLLELSDQDRTRLAAISSELARFAVSAKHATMTMAMKSGQFEFQIVYESFGSSPNGELTSLLDELEVGERRLRAVARIRYEEAELDDDKLRELETAVLVASPEDAAEELQRQNQELIRVIADREAAQAALRVSEERLRIAGQAAGFGAWELEAGNIIHLADPALALLELNKSRVALADFLERMESDELSDAIEALREEGTRFQIDARLRRSRRWVRISGTAVSTSTGARLVGALLDVTDRIRREKEAAVRLELEQQLVGIVSHDLKSPLGAIIMGLSLLSRRSLDDDSQELVKRMQRSAHRAKTLILDLLDFSAVRLGGELQIRRGPTDLRELVKSVIQQVELSRQLEQVDLNVQGETEVSVDGARVGQALANLIDNAAKHGDGHIAIDVRVGDDYRIAVSNVGYLSEGSLEKMFEPLQSTDTNRASLGLGLYIVRRICRAHGGEVVATSSNGRVTIEMVLPAA